jgi:hypothetical protein
MPFHAAADSQPATLIRQRPPSRCASSFRQPPPPQRLPGVYLLKRRRFRRRFSPLFVIDSQFHYFPDAAAAS